MINNSASFDLYWRFLCAKCSPIQCGSVDVVGDQKYCLEQKLCLLKVSPLILLKFPNYFHAPYIYASLFSSFLSSLWSDFVDC